MPPVECRKCKGRGGFRNKRDVWVDCNACVGRGINDDLWQASCRNCSAPLVYKKGQQEPTHCKDCRNIEQTKQCGQWGCENIIRYKIGWSTIPTFCGHCQKMSASGATAKWCEAQRWGSRCGKLIWVPRGKNYTKCRECSDRERAEKEAQWKTKSCSSCGSQIKYHVDWTRVPDLCNDCKEKEKAKWKTKPCAGGCGNSIKYNTDWDHPPNFCKDCKDKQKAQKRSATRDGQYETTDTSNEKNLVTIFRRDILPSNVRDIRGKVEVSDGHVTMFFPRLGGPKGYRVSWNGQGSDLHWTNQNVDKNHPDRHKPPQ